MPGGGSELCLLHFFLFTKTGIFQYVSAKPFTQTSWLRGKESARQFRRLGRHGFEPQVGKIPWRRKWQLTQVFLPGESHGQRSLADCSPWGCKKSNRESVGTHVGAQTHRAFEIRLLTHQCSVRTVSLAPGLWTIWWAFCSRIRGQGRWKGTFAVWALNMLCGSGPWD